MEDYLKLCKRAFLAKRFYFSVRRLIVLIYDNAWKA